MRCPNMLCRSVSSALPITFSVASSNLLLKLLLKDQQRGQISNRFVNDLMTRYYESLILAQSKQTMCEQLLKNGPIKSQEELVAPISLDSAAVKYVIGKSCYYCKYDKKKRNMGNMDQWYKSTAAVSPIKR